MERMVHFAAFKSEKNKTSLNLDPIDKKGTDSLETFNVVQPYINQATKIIPSKIRMES